MKLDKYIKELLFYNDSIIISNFGGFEKYTESAKIEDNTGTINPPRVKIKFNPEQKKDSGVLSNHIVKQEKISKEEADKQINQTVIRWNDSLKEGSKLKISDIGFIELDKDGNKKFEITNDLSDFPDAFGLPVINISKQPEKNIKKDIKKPIKKEDKKLIKTAKTTKDIKKTIVDKQKEPIKINSKKKKKVLFAALITIPIIAIVMFGLLNPKKVSNTFNQTTEYISGVFSSDNSDTPKEKIEEVEPIETDSVFERTKIALENYSIISSQTNNPITIDKESIESISKVNTIAGSFQSKVNAKRVRNKLKRKGFKAEILPINQSYYRISVGSYNNIEEAINDIDRLKTIDNISFWYLVD